MGIFQTYGIRIGLKTTLITLVFCSGACQTDDAGGLEVEIPTVEAGELPLLSGTNRIGMIEGFNISNPSATIDSMAVRWSEAKSAGMTVGRVQLDWSELETTPGSYDKTALQGRLEDLKAQDLQPLLLISAYDSDGTTVPFDLDGTRMNDERLVNRFKALLEWVVPMLVENGGWAISISNEPDNSFGEIPTLAADMASFTGTVRDYVHTISPELAVTVTFAAGNLAVHSDAIRRILAECDVACWNFYGSYLDAENNTYTTKSVPEIYSSLDALLKLSNTQKVVIQELGMHIGLDSSPEIQRQFYQTFFEQMQVEAQLEAAFAFQLVDWSPETLDIYTESFDTESFPPGLLEAFVESLGTIGLLNQNNGQARPAWDELTLWIRRFR